MKVYFTGSLHNENIDQKLYKQIASILQKMKHEVKSTVLTIDAEELDVIGAEERARYYRKLKQLMSWADAVVGEVSYPSTINIGHEVSLALDLGKPIVCLYQPGREPGILQGISADKFILLEYEPEDLAGVLEYGLEEAGERMDVRFNFFISPKISHYLDTIAKERKVPRAVYLRRLIDEDMAKNEEYRKEEM